LKRIIKKMIVLFYQQFSVDKSIVYSIMDDINMTYFINL